MTELVVDNKFLKEHQARVFLVDDQLIVAEALRRMLEGIDDIEYAYCLNPVVAVMEAAQFRPTVILQDLVMPSMNGLMLLSALRSTPSTSDIPVVVLSSKEDPKIKSEAFALGAADYLVKFPDRIEMLARIRAHTRSYLAQRQRDEAYRQLRELQAELEQKNVELERLSCSDGLTGILNRRSFDNYLHKEWLRASREKKEIALLMMDIDYFKAFNDHYGHQGGDACLCKVARELSENVRRPSDIVARYGGEEFVVVLPDSTLEGAAIIAEVLREKIQALNIEHDFSPVARCVTISLGVASIVPSNETTAEMLIKFADEALYHAKAAGRNRHSVYLPSSGAT